MSERFCMSRRVEFMDTDMAGIVHFTAYFRYMETAEHELFRSLGLTIGVQDTTPHIGWPRVSCNFDYFGSLHFGEDFEVQIGVQRIGAKSITYEAEIVRDCKVLARGHSTSACCELGDDRKLHAVAVPTDTAEKLKRYLTPETDAQEKP